MRERKLREGEWETFGASNLHLKNLWKSETEKDMASFVGGRGRKEETYRKWKKGRKIRGKQETLMLSR